MLASSRARMLALLAFGLAVAPTHASAWTKTRLEEAHARLDLQPSGDARVELRVVLRVLGGWLSGFEVTGLSPGAQLTSEPPAVLVADDGTERPMEADLSSDGTLRLSAPRARAARRGRHTLRLTYRLDASALHPVPSENGFVQMRWQLPAWKQGLGGVTVRVHAPPGSRPLDPPTPRAEIEEPQIEEGSKRHVMRWRRVHLPRTVPWTIHFEVPRNALQGVGDAARASEHAASISPASASSPWAWMALLMCIVGLKRAALTLRYRREHLIAQPLIPWLHGPLRMGLWVLCATVAIGLATASTVAAHLACLIAVALGVDRTVQRRAPEAEGRWAPAGALHAARARTHRLLELWGPAAWLDITTPLGAASLGMAGTVVLAAHAGSVVWADSATSVWMLAAPLWLTGTRKHMPLAAVRRLAMLEREEDAAAARALEARRLHVEAQVYGIRDRVRRVRLWLTPHVAPEGLRSWSLVSADTGATIPTPRAVWVVRTRVGSPAHRGLSEAALRGRRLHSADGREEAWIVEARGGAFDAIEAALTQAGSTRDARPTSPVADVAA